MGPRAVLVLAVFAVTAYSCGPPSIDGVLHADGAALGTWDLEAATCTADQTGASTVDAPGGGAVPNVRISAGGSGARLEVRGLARTEPVWFGPADCTTLDVVAIVDGHTSGRAQPAYSVDGHATFDCVTAEGHVRGSVRFQDCQ